MNNTENSVPPISLKLLLEPSLASSIIGKGGQAINGLTEITGARIKISNINDCYPGTTDQVILICGGDDEVDAAQELIWHRISQHMQWKSKGSNEVDIFNPRETLESIRRGETMNNKGHPVTGRLLIPLSVCGAVIGPNGILIRSLSKETGVRVQLSSKDDGVSHITQERIVMLTGEVEDCIQCTANIIKMMQEDGRAIYENKTVSYVNLNLVARGSSKDVAIAPNLAFNSQGLPPGLSVVSAVTTLTLSISDQFAGQVIGRKGSVLSELQSKSGASISVSPRSEESAENAGKRTIILVGSPSEVQAAFNLLTSKLWNATEPSRSHGGGSGELKPQSHKRSSPPKGSSSKPIV